MAFTGESKNLHYLFRDAGKASAQTLIPFLATVLLEQIATYGIAAITDIEQISTLQPYGMNILHRRTNNAAGASGTDERERKGVLLFRVDVRGKPSMKVSIPGIKQDVLATDNKTIDQTNANVQALLQAILRGKQADGTTDIVAGVTGCISPRGGVLINEGDATAPLIKAAYMYHRASGVYGQRRRST